MKSTLAILIIAVVIATASAFGVYTPVNVSQRVSSNGLELGPSGLIFYLEGIALCILQMGHELLDDVIYSLICFLTWT